MSEPPVPPNIVDVQVTEETIANVIVMDAGPKVIEVDVADVGMRGAQGEKGDTGNTGPQGPQGTPGGTMLYGAGGPGTADGTPGQYYTDTITGIIYGPKAGSESLLAGVTQTTTEAYTNFEVGMIFDVVNAGYVTALKWYRHASDTATARVLKLWNYTTGVQMAGISTAGLGVETGSGWKTIPHSPPLYLPVGEYVVSYNVTTAFTSGNRTDLNAGNTVTASLRVKGFGYNSTANAMPIGGAYNALADVAFTPADPITSTFFPDNEMGTTSVVVGAGAAQELGTRLKVTVDGRITAVRIPRGPGAPTSHIVNVWGPTGTLLATATSANEYGNGMWTVPLATPVAVTAGTVYTVSYFSADGTTRYYTPRRANPNATNGGMVFINNFYKTNATSAFPVSVHDNGLLVGAVLTYDSPWPIASPDVNQVSIGQPPSNLDNPPVASGGMWLNTSDGTLYGPKAQVDNIRGNFTTIANGTVRTAECGAVVTVARPGLVTALGFYRGANETQTTRTLKLWSYNNQAAGTLLGSVVTTAETGSGWKSYPLAAPIPVTAGEYVVSFDANAGFPPAVTMTPGCMPRGTGNVVARLAVLSGAPGAYPNGASSSDFFPDLEFVAAETTTLTLRTGKDAAAYSGSPSAGEYGVLFQARAACRVTALRFWRPGGATITTRTMNLWTTTGSLLATATTTGEANVIGGWVRAPLGTPYDLTPGTQYVVSVTAPASSGNVIAYSYNAPIPPPSAALRYLHGRFNVSSTPGANPASAITTDYGVDVEVSYVDQWPQVGGTKPVRMDAYVFPGTYTWTRPAGATRVVAVIQQAGGGGGAGRRGAAGTIRSGGSGGGGGSQVITEYAAADLPGTVVVKVGSGGTAGAAATADDTNGGNGNGGNLSSFGDATFNAYIGNPGAAGQGGLSGAGAPGSSGALGQSGSSGTSATGTAGSAGGYAGMPYAASAGGGGGGLTTANASSNGGGTYDWPNSTNYRLNAGGVGGAAGASGTLTIAAYNTAQPWPPGPGGPGGGSGSAGVGGNGLDGYRGGGGGGGGASVNGFNSGAGGRGGDGFVQVISYF